MKKILMSFWGALALVLLAAASVAAQGLGRLDGQILDTQGNPYPDVTVVIKNPDTGQTHLECVLPLRDLPPCYQRKPV